MSWHTLIKTLIASFLSTAWATSPFHMSDANVQKFMKQTAASTHLPYKTIYQDIAKAHFQGNIIEKMNHPYEKLPWTRYKGFFLTPSMKHGGAALYIQYRKNLQVIENKYGVPAEVIVAILGVESRYGHARMPFRAIDALSTLGFSYPKRSPFFLQELRALITLAHQQNRAITEYRGSYAGALGVVQFMPSNILKYAVDENKDGKISLETIGIDAFASIALYLKKHGWKPNTPIAYRLKKPHQGKHILNLDEHYYRIYTNFNIIMTYNHSPAYAMVVTELAKSIKQKAAIMQKVSPKKKPTENKKTTQSKKRAPLIKNLKSKNKTQTPIIHTPWSKHITYWFKMPAIKRTASS